MCKMITICLLIILWISSLGWARLGSTIFFVVVAVDFIFVLPGITNPNHLTAQTGLNGLRTLPV